MKDDTKIGQWIFSVDWILLLSAKTQNGKNILPEAL